MVRATDGAAKEIDTRGLRGVIRCDTTRGMYRNGKHENRPDPTRHVGEFIKGELFASALAGDLGAEEAIQEFISKKYGRWMARAKDASDVGGFDKGRAWEILCGELRRAVVATGRYAYDAGTDRFMKLEDSPVP